MLIVFWNQWLFVKESKMKKLIDLKGEFTLFCKSPKDLAWLTPLFEFYSVIIVTLYKRDEGEFYSWQERCGAKDPREYPIQMGLRFKRRLSPYSIQTLLQLVTLEGCKISSCPPPQPGKNQYIIDIHSNEKPIAFDNMELVTQFLDIPYEPYEPQESIS